MLDCQISNLCLEQLLASSDRAAVEQEAAIKTAPLQSPRDFVCGPVLLEFLAFLAAESCSKPIWESASQPIAVSLLELGRGFAFVGQQYRVSSETKDFYIDLVFYDYLLKCFVLFDLQSGELTHEDIGQMDMYVRMMDDLELQS